MNKQLDCLFVVANSSQEAYQELSHSYSAIETDTWSLLLAQSCRSKGYGVGILDCVAERLTLGESVTKIRQANPRLVVFVIYGQNPNSGTVNMIGAYKLGNLLKETYPEYFICMVGSHVSALPKEVLGYGFVDFILLNEGVYALHNILKTNLKDDLDKVKGIGHKKDGLCILNSPEIVVPQDRMDIDLPGMAWDLLPYKNKPFDLYRSHFWHAEFNHEKRNPFAAIYTSIGCMFKCEFCMINIINRNNNDDNITSSDSKGMRFWSPDFIIKEFEKLAHYGVETIRVSDEMFFLNRKYYEPLLNKIVERGLKFNMWVYSRVDSCNSQYFELFKKAGVNWLALGIESANQNIRTKITKGSFKDINIREVVRNIRNSDINVISNYIFGFPDDTKQTMQQTLDLALELNTETVNMYACAALPGSPLHLKAKQNNWKLPESYSGYGFLSYDCLPLRTKHCTAEEVLQFRDEAWTTYFQNPNYLNLVEKQFGLNQRNNVEDMSKIKLKRKILGD